MTLPHYVYFDVETERLSHEVGGWSNIEQLGFAIGVTLSSRDDQFRVYRAAEIPQLLTELRECDCVVGYNLRNFDFRVLQPYADFSLRDLLALDLMLDLKDRAGFRAKLDNVASATLGEAKSSEGTQSVDWWRAGRHEEVIQYCKQDVLLTRKIHEWGATHGSVRLLDRRGQMKTVPVAWSLEALPVFASASPLPVLPPEQPSLFD